MKRILAMALSVLLVATMAIGGSVAYLTDRSGAVNVMTTGLVDIEQYEQDRNGNNFKQDQMLLPLVTPVGTKDAAGYPECENYVDKIITVENTGNTEAYVRTLIAMPEYTYVNQEENNASANVLHWNGYSYGDLAANYPAAVKIPGTDKVASNNWWWGKETTPAWPGNGGVWNTVGNVTINGQAYTVYIVTNVAKMASGERTAPNMIGVYLDSKVDYNHDGKYYTYEGNKINGLEGTVEVLALSQGVQAGGFENAWDAFSAAFDNGAEQPTAAQLVEWFTGVIEDHETDTWDGSMNTEWFDAEKAAAATAENPVVFEIETAEEFTGFVNLANTNSFKNVTVKLTKDIDMGGTNWNADGSTAIYGPAFNGTLDGAGHTIKNLTAENNWTYANALFRTIGHDATFKNLTFENANINNANDNRTSGNSQYAIIVGIVGGGTVNFENITIRNSSVKSRGNCGLLVGGMTEGAIYVKNCKIENSHVTTTADTTSGAAFLGSGYSHHDLDYAGMYVDDISTIDDKSTLTIKDGTINSLPPFNYVK